MRHLNIMSVNWPAKGVFRISRSALMEIPVVQVEITEGEYCGRGECRPYARYGESVETVTAQIEDVRSAIENGISTDDLQSAMPPGAARNAVDCALWDLRAKIENTPVWELLGLPKPQARTSAFTLSVDTPDAMEKAATAAMDYPVLKMKIGADGAAACVKAVMKARPDAQFIIDANEAMTPESLKAFKNKVSSGNILMIEQPLPAKNTHIYDAHKSPIICADEALHTAQDLNRLWDMGYRAVNVKLDKCGGLTEGLALIQAAKTKGFSIMAGCMVSSSLAMAPMLMLESFADVIDLDGPLLLAKDIPNGLRYDGPVVHPPSRKLWG